MHQIDPRPIVLIAGHPELTGNLFHAVVRKGFQAAGPFRSTAEALSWAELWKPDLAVLDGTFEEGRTDELADLLRRLGVLVLVCNEVGVCSKPSAHPVECQSPTREHCRKLALISHLELEKT